MKIVAIVGVILVCLYFWNNQSDGSLSKSECADLGGKLTEHGCETPISKEQCESVGGTLRDSDCVMKETKIQ